MKTWVAVLLAGCTTTTYGYQYKLQQQFNGGEEPEAAPREARELLAAAKTVAFYPPDECLNSDSSIGHDKLAEIHARCGATMSGLERAAEDAGYEVLSWQNLRGSKRPIEYAREANVDVLFEVNDIEPTVLDDTTVKHTFSFFEENGNHGDTPLEISTSVAQTCRDFAFNADPAKAAALTGSIDIKTVAVSDGRDRWHYRKTEARALDRAYPRVRFTAPNAPNRFAGIVAGVGLVGVSLGGTGLLLDAITTDDPTTTTVDEHINTSGWATPLLIGGIVLMAAGTAVGIVSTSKPDPATTLCNGTFAVATTLPSAPAGVVSSEHTFEQTHRSDELAEMKQQIIARMTKQFVDELKAARASRPGLTTTPTPPPPPPAPVSPRP